MGFITGIHLDFLELSIIDCDISKDLTDFISPLSETGIRPASERLCHTRKLLNENIMFSNDEVGVIDASCYS
jgi:hypothetical protein